MSKKVLLLHGWGGSDTPHWQSYIASEIAKEYGKISFLRFSNYDEPKLDVWLNELKKELNIPMKVLPNAGHINSDSSYGKWEWFLEKVKSGNLDIN